MSRTDSKDESEEKDETNLKIPAQPNPAFPGRPSREPDEAGSEDMVSKDGLSDGYDKSSETSSREN